MGERVGVTACVNSIRLSFQYKGVQCRESIKLKPNKANMKYAERMKAEIDRKIGMGAFSYSDYFPDSKSKYAKMFGEQTASITIDEGLQRYIASNSKTLAPSTLREYQSSQRMISEAIGDCLISKISTLELREWINSLTCSNKRINNILVPLRGMFKDFYSDGIIERNPMDRIKNLSISKHEPEPFAQDELSRITACMSERMANMVNFAAWTGLRTGELFALTWQDIDFNRKTCRINKSITRGELKLSPKTDASVRDVELLPSALDALAKQKQHSFMTGKEIWIQENGKPFLVDKQFRERSWQFALKKAGVRYRPPYQLRHTYASTMLSAGANPMWVAKQLGHSDWGMIRKVYGRWLPQGDSELDRMAAKLGQKSDSSTDSQTIAK